jgi:hypothetical protein
MTKKIFSILALTLAISSVASANVRFREITSYEEIPGQLPATLMLTFKLACFEKFVDVIRHDTRNEKTNEVTIAVGGLVDGDPTPCPSNSGKLISVEAGGTFSGVPYHIEAIH